ncbi:LysE family transporter [Psychrobacter pygoscelis]|uniref:LysE family transporter n=1 Tax=Psychrobacter pygoscelis TaxID=2488563 RepID=UPI001039904B|nr:LysE family transporter [Psychrobacter pygoscelis]
MATFIVNHPSIMLTIKILGTLYLLWLTHQMARSDFSTIVNDALNREKLGRVRPSSALVSCP